MTDAIPPLQKEKIQWNSPILIIGLLAALIVFVGWIVFFLGKIGREGGRVATDGAKFYAPGAMINQERAVEAVGSLATDSPQSTLLVKSNLRTTYNGLLHNWYENQ